MTLDITAVFLALGVIFGAIVAMLQARMTYQYAALAARQKEQERVGRLTAEMLIAWAQYGDWPPECKAALMEAIRKYGPEPPPRETPPVSLGMDAGVGLVLEGVWSRMRGRRA